MKRITPFVLLLAGVTSQAFALDSGPLVDDTADEAFGEQAYSPYVGQAYATQAELR